MYYTATEKSDIFLGFQQEKKQKIPNRLTYVHWFALYSKESNLFMPVSELTTLFTVPSAKWKCENWPLFKNIKFFLSSGDSFSTCHSVFYLLLMSHSFRQWILLGHAQTFMASQAPSCKSGCIYDPPAGRSLLPLPTSCSQSEWEVNPGIFPSHMSVDPLTHGDGPRDKWSLCPGHTRAEGCTKGHPLNCVVSLRQGRLLPGPSLRHCWADIFHLDSPYIHTQTHAGGAELQWLLGGMEDGRLNGPKIPGDREAGPGKSMSREVGRR